MFNLIRAFLSITSFSMVAASGGTSETLKRVKEVHTKIDKNDKNPKKTVLTIDYTGCTVNDLIGPAEDSLIISWQGRARRSKVIPASQTINAKQFIESLRQRVGGPETVDTLAAKVGTMSADEQAALLKRLQESMKAGQRKSA